VYAGTDPLTRRAIRLKATAKTEQQAHIELGRLLKEASEGRTPESNATVAKLLDEYAAIAESDDLLAYQASMRRERREALDRMAQQGQAAGLYDATSGPPVRTR
jgi:hypothetical protein